MKRRRKLVAGKFNVFVGKKKIDSVFFTGYTDAEVKRSLVDHDGYPHNIRVTRVRGSR